MLRAVHAELGPSAAIAEVNRVRSGGFAGFFTREEFEVIVEGDDISTGDHSYLDDADLDADGVDLRTDHHTDGWGDDLRVSAEPLANRVEPVAAESAVIAADERFQQLLERALEERADAEDAANLRSIGHAAGPRRDPAPMLAEPTPSYSPAAPQPPGQARTVVERQQEIEPEPDAVVESWAEVVVEPEPVVEAVVEAEAEWWQEPSTGRRRDDDFWARLSRARDEVGHLAAAQPATVGVVGPLRSIVPILRRLERHDEGPGQRDVIVLTNRAEIVSQPSWRLVRDGARMVSAVSALRSPAVIAIDIEGELPIWVGPLLDRLRRGGMELIRVAATGLVDDTKLAAIESAVAGPLLIDVLGSVDPRRALQLIDEGRPVASIGGVPMSAELLVALRHEAQRG